MGLGFGLESPLRAFFFLEFDAEPDAGSLELVCLPHGVTTVKVKVRGQEISAHTEVERRGDGSEHHHP